MTNSEKITKGRDRLRIKLRGKKYDVESFDLMKIPIEWLYQDALSEIGEQVPSDVQDKLLKAYTDTDEDSKQIRQLYARINKLAIMDRALVLLWLENLSYEEIGAIAGISAKNVSVKLVRIKQQLMKMSDNQEF